MKRKLVIDDAVPYAKEIFSQFGEVVALPGKSIQTDDLMDADALIVRSRTQVNADLLEGTPVSFVGSTVVGLDHVDQVYLQQKGITFYSAQGCNANSVSEYVITNLINLAVKQDFELSEKSIGIIGVGHVGKRVEKKAKALGMKVVLNDPPRAIAEVNSAEVNSAEVPNFQSLDDALACDMVTVHTPLTFDGSHPTHHLLSAEKLSQIQPHQILINAARGGIIDEAAWVTTQTAANIIDCWENEPNIDEALYNKADLATPHIAGHALDAKIKGSTMVFDALCQAWQHTPNHDWQNALPTPPQTLEIHNTESTQSAIYELLQHCYRPEDDDIAIRGENILETHKKYEYYRRHYPIHREWNQQNIIKTTNEKINNLLFLLDFKLSIS